jgi:predicted ATPase/class 3 adenylate cyclase
VTETSSNDRRIDLPRGTVTFLFTDIEGSTKLLQRLGDDYADVLATHRSLLRAAFDRHGGVEVDTQGDAFFVAFSRPGDAIDAALDAQRALLAHEWPRGERVLVRMGIHTGVPVVLDNNYVGIDVHRAARICDSAHGGQVVVSEATRHLINDGARLIVDFRDLGLHRLKDLDQPERVLQLVAGGLPADFPPLRSLKPPTNVPRGIGALVGRGAEIDELRGLLLEGDARIVTVTGAGGTGKTRLATAVAIDVLDHFVNGVFFVDLSATQTAERVASAIAEVVGVQDEGGTAANESIARHISDKQMLLLLDNFEQALDGARVVSDLLNACPHLRALITSRIALSIEGEREFPLAPLGLPEHPGRAEAEASEAVQLFVRRATEAVPGFALSDDNAAAVAEICVLLDGLPLAIELAAARVKLFSPQALVARLDDRFKLLTGGASDRPDRHRTLRSTIDWSYDLLSQDERAFFRDFAVFRGGATFEAAEHVIGDGIDTLDALAALVDHSLLLRRDEPGGEVSFSMLNTVRDYALEQLSSDPDHARLRERHALYYLDVARSADSRESEADAELDVIGADHDNMRAALTWWLAGADEGSDEAATRALELATALGRYWYTHGHALEGGEWLERALAAADSAPEDVRSHALRRLGVLMDQQGRRERARELFEEALAYFRKSGDRAGEAACLNSLGIVARSLEDVNAAEELFDAATALRRELGDVSGTASALGNLGLVAIDRGDLDRAERLLEETLELDRTRGDEWGIACTLSNLGIVHMKRRNFPAAEKAIVDALTGFEDMGDLDGVAETIEGIAELAAARADAERAARLASAADALRRSVGIPLAPIDGARFQRWLEGPRRALGDEAFEKAWSEGAEMTPGQAIEYARESGSPGFGL